MTRIVTTHYRYKRPPPKRKPVAAREGMPAASFRTVSNVLARGE